MDWTEGGNGEVGDLDILVAVEIGTTLFRGVFSDDDNQKAILSTKPRNPQSVHEIHGFHGLSMDFVLIFTKKGNFK